MNRHRSSLLAVLVPCLLAWGCTEDPDDELGGATGVGGGSSTGLGEDGSGESAGESSGDTGEPATCNGPLASGVALRDVALFQVLAVDAMRDGVAVDPQARRVPLIAGRGAVVRAQLDVDPTWETHDLGLSVEVTIDGSTQTFLGVGDDHGQGLTILHCLARLAGTA